MADNLKNRTVLALMWNGVDKFFFQFVALIVGIITARFLSPQDFGFIGALAVFTMLSNILVESGFTSALIRRDGNTDNDYSAIFFVNILIAVVIYLILFFSAPYIALFFRMPELCSLSRFLFLSIIINSFGIVQNIILSKSLSFKIISLADLTSAVVSGVATVLMVMNGFGYWALAWQILLQNIVRVAFLWAASSWRVSFHPSFGVIKEVFSFSSFMLFSSFINTVVKNIYSVIIGRLFNPAMLGFYSQANKYQQIPSTVIQSTISGVAYPVLSNLKDDEARQLMYLRKIVRIAACVIFPVMFGLAALMAPLVSILLTDKWLPAVPYFQIMVPVAVVLPFHALNTNLVLIRGFSKTNLLLEAVKNGLILLSVFAVYALASFTSCIEMDINWLLIFFSVANILSYLFDMFVSQRLAGYRVISQLKDILPYFLVSAVMFAVVSLLDYLNAEHALIGSKIASTAVLMVIAVAFYAASLKILGSKVFDEAWSLIVKRRIS
ncbi:MAG: lipopolysaccharide biosynthesis protein [Paludibacteraceae bacterium]|nr:lipopolysaccharide biosynthesis protein [Paludibacteraceae bacterium]